MRSSILLRWIWKKAAAGSHVIPRRGCSNLCRGNSSSAPWLMLAPSGGYNYFYSVGEEKVIRLKQGSQEEEGALLVGSSHGWVALYKEKEQERAVFLSNPITGEQMKLPAFPPDKRRRVAKVILSSPPHEHDCRAAMALDNGSLSLCAPGRSTAWTPPVSNVPYQDLVYSGRNRQLFCLVDSNRFPTCRYDLEGWDLSDAWCPRMEWSEKLEDLEHRLQNSLRERWCFVQRRYLVHVEHTDDLLLVTRYSMDQMAPDGSYAEDEDDESRIYPAKTMAFGVHALDRRRPKWIFMEGSLGGLSLFVGRNQSLAVPGASPHLQPDSIYFTDSHAHHHDDDEVYGGHDIGIFDYKKATISSCYYPCHYATLKKIHPSPLWFTPTPYS